MRLLPAVLLASLVFLGAAGLAAPAPAVASVTPRACAAGWAGFEPTLGVDPAGVLFVSAVPSTDGLLYEPHVLRSADPCAGWADVSPRVGGQVVPPATFDPYVHVDADTGRVFTTDLAFLACPTLSFSDDAGAAWTTSAVSCGLATVQDHQTLFTGAPRPGLPAPVGYPNVVYECVALLVGSGCASSLDGGLTFGPSVPVYADGLCEEGSLTGHGAASRGGVVFLGRGDCGVPTVAVSRDEGLSWNVTAVSAPVGAPNHEVSVAVDDAGRAYAFWMGPDGHPYLATSDDLGGTWAPARDVAPAGVGRAILPSVVAGSAGRLALAYVASAPATPTLWDAYLAYSTDGGATFSTHRVNAAADPVARGDCQETGKWCAMGDFLDVVITPEGRAWMAYVDTCNGLCDAGGPAQGSTLWLATLDGAAGLR